MLNYTLDQIMYLAGVYHTDNDMEKDLKICQWLQHRKYRIVTDTTNNHVGSRISIQLIEE